MSHRDHRQPRRLLATAAAGVMAVLLLPASPAAAQEPHPCLSENPPAWCVQWGEPEPDPGGGGGGGGGGGPVVGSPAPTYAHYTVRSRISDEGELCEQIEVLEWSTQPPPADRTRQAAQEELQRRLDTPVIYYHAGYVHHRVACPGPEVAVDVTTLAVAAWAALDAPAFDVEVAPGRALTGMPAYVELSGPTTATEVVPLPDGLGELRIEAAVVDHTIDFGDGSAPVTTTSLGAPWNGDPAQQIAHTYTHTGTHTITVTTGWNATFSSPSQSGDLAPRVEVANFELPVTQVQAVRVDR